MRVLVLVEAHGEVAHQRRPAGLFGRQRRVDAIRGGEHVVDHRAGARERRALGQEDARLQGIAVDLRKGPELECAACDRRHREDQRRDRHAEGQVAPPHGEGGHRSGDPVANPAQPALDAALHRALVSPLRPQRPAEVMGQDQERLDERDREHREHDHRHHAQHLPYVALQEGEGAEHAERRQERGQHPRRDLPHPGERRVERRCAGVALARDALGDDDGVVHQQADDDQQPDHGQHVERVAERHHRGDPADERHRQPRGDPERVARAEEQPHGDGHQREAHGAVLDQKREAVAHDVGRAAHDGEGHVGRCAQALLLQKRRDPVGDAQQVVGGGFGDVEEGGGAAVELDHLLLGLKAVVEAGDVAEADLRALRGRDDHEVAQRVEAAPLVGEAQQKLSVRRLDRADRQVDILAADAFGDVLEAQAVAAQRRLGDLDAELALGEPGDGDLRDAAIGLHAPLDRLGVGLQVGAGERAGDRDGGDEIGAAQLLDDGRLGDVGEVVDGVDLGLDVGREAVEHRALAHLDRGDGAALQRLAGDLVDVVDIVHRVLDPLAERLLDVLGAGAGIGDGDLKARRLDPREGLALEAGRERRAERQQADHQQVGDGRVADEIGDHRATSPPAWVSTGASSMPPIAAGRSPSTMRSPNSTPPAIRARSPCTARISTGRTRRRLSASATKTRPSRTAERGATR